MADIEKSRKKGKGKKAQLETQDDAAAANAEGNATVSSLISAGLADLHNSGLLDDGATESVSEGNAEANAEINTEIDWQMADQDIVEDVLSADAENEDALDAKAAMDEELGTIEESEHMIEAAQAVDGLEAGDIGASDEAESEILTAPEEVLTEEEAAIADQELGPAEFIEADQVLSIIEALLFASDRPVSVSTIKQIFKGSNIRTKDITRAIDELASDYASSRRGVTLEEVNGGFQLRTKVDNADFLRRLSKSRPFRLSGPALETLSIIAYKQPITKHEMDEIRGVESGHLVRALMERGLVNFAGKSDLPGKPMLYQTTRKFLEIFGLRNLKELPTLAEIDELLPEGIGAEEEADKPKLADITGDLAAQVGSSYSEGEDELEKINASLAQVDTTSEFFEQEKVRQREKRDAERAADIREALAVGEAVDIKDQRWLTRYEAKLAAPQVTEDGQPIAAEGEMPGGEEPMAAAATEASDSGDEHTEEFSKDIETLSEDLQADNRLASEDDEAEEGEADFAMDSESEMEWEALSDDGGPIDDLDENLGEDESGNGEASV